MIQKAGLLQTQRKILVQNMVWSSFLEQDKEGNFLCFHAFLKYSSETGVRSSHLGNLLKIVTRNQIKKERNYIKKERKKERKYEGEK